MIRKRLRGLQLPLDMLLMYVLSYFGISLLFPSLNVGLTFLPSGLQVVLNVIVLALVGYGIL